jgi:hypothetical protein
MPTMFVPLKLKDGADKAAYEKWALERDIPTAAALDGVDSFVLHRIERTIDGAPSPYDYVEVITISDLDAFGKAASASAEMPKIVEELNGFIDGAPFMLGEIVE